MNDDSIFDDQGYITSYAIENLTYLQVKLALSDKIIEVKQQIAEKERELSEIKGFLSCVEHSDRIVWLSYQDDRAPERRVLG